MSLSINTTCNDFLTPLLVSIAYDELHKGSASLILGSKMLRRFRIPFPPLAEQQRIVAKVDELMALCDELEVQLTEAATTRRQLLEATLCEAIAS